MAISQIHYDGPGELYISGIEEPRTQPLTEFDTVITVCQDTVEDHIPRGVDYYFFKLADGPDDTYGGSDEYELFAEGADMLHDELSDDRSVLIHCHVGISRSTSTSIAALGRLLSIKRYEAYAIVERYRPQLNPKMELMDHASKYINEHE